MLGLLILFLSQLPVDSSRVYLERGIVKEEEGYLATALHQYSRAKDLTNDDKTMARALNGMTSVNITIGRYDSVLAYLEQSKKLDTTAYNLMKNLQVEAKYWQTQNQYDLALTALQSALDYATKLNDRKNMAIILSSMGGIHFSHDPDMNTARGFYNRSIALCDSSQHANILARNYGRLANSYMVESDGVNAEKYLKRARKITDISGNLPLRGYILSSMATLLFGQEKYQEALEFMQETIRIKRELWQLRQRQNDLLNISKPYMMVKDFSKAKKSLDEGLEIGKSLKDIVYLKYFYDRRSMLDSMQGDYRGAYSNLKLAMAYKDSTFSSQHIRDVREVQEKYEAEQKEKTIAEKELEIEHQKYQQALILGASIIAVLMLIVILVIIRTRSRNKLQREREHQNYLRLQTIVKTQEDVQQRIARDLHDGLVQVLGAAKMSLQSVGPDSDRSLLQKHIRSASDIMDEAVTEARSISHQILPYSLLKDGLIAALEELFARSLASFDFDHDGDQLHVNEQTAINIYRIAQELVNNVQKHAESAHVSVSLKASRPQLKFIFSDNGKGYDITKSTTGAGLSNMATRTGLLGGTIEVRSVIGKGTTTELTVPL